MSEILGAIFGFVRGATALCAVLSASVVLIGAVLGRLLSLDHRDRHWLKVRDLASKSLYCLIFGGLGCTLGASYPDILNFPMAISAGLLILAACMNFVAFLLIPGKPEPAPGEAGASTRAMARRRKLIAVSVLLVGGFFLMAALVLFAENKALMMRIGGAGILIVLLLVRLSFDLLDALTRKLEKEARRAERGAEAEERVGQILERLGDDVFVLHDIESPYGNIDHLAITREGKIFLLETKSHRGRVSVSENQLLLNGHPMEKDPIGQVLRNLFWLRDRLRETTGLEPGIRGLVVFSRAFVPEPLTVKGVRVINIRNLERTLRTEGQGNPEIWEARERIREILSLPQRKIEPPSEESVPEPGKFRWAILLVLILLVLVVYSVLGVLIFKAYF